MGDGLTCRLHWWTYQHGGFVDSNKRAEAKYAVVLGSLKGEYHGSQWIGIYVLIMHYANPNQIDSQIVVGFLQSRVVLDS